MSLFVLEYRYADLNARARVRPDHLAYMQSLYEEGKVLLAGPVGDGTGAMAVLRVGSEDEAWRIVKGDPYTAAGVGIDHLLRAWNVAVPTQSD